MYIFPFIRDTKRAFKWPAKQLKCNVFTIFCLSPWRCFNYGRPFPTVPALCTCADASNSPLSPPIVRFVLSMASGVVVVVVAIFVFSMYLNCHKYQSKSNAHEAQQRERESGRALPYLESLALLRFFGTWHFTLSAAAVRTKLPLSLLFTHAFCTGDEMFSDQT